MIRPPSNLARLRAAWRNAAAVPERAAPCFRMVDAADVPKLYVYDFIGGWDSDAGEFVQAVHGLDAKVIDLHVNSPGGFVYDAVAMYEALDSHPATVNVHVDGLAASAASFLAMVGDSRRISRGGRMMIHDAQVLAMGSPADLREAADLADSVSDDIAGYYAARAGGKPGEWRTAMRAETWYSATQAKDAGLVDAVQAPPAKDKDKGPDNRTRLLRARHRALSA
jgi:ATP-dependent protease ClpP protease subunit